MRKRDAGRLVFCQLSRLVAAPYRGAYCAAKFAVELSPTRSAWSLRNRIRSCCRAGSHRPRFLENALAAYRRNVDLESSPHREIYRARIAAWSRAAVKPSSSGRGGSLKLAERWKAEAKAPLLRYSADLRRGRLRRVLPAGALDAIAARN